MSMSKNVDPPYLLVQPNHVDFVKFRQIAPNRAKSRQIFLWLVEACRTFPSLSKFRATLSNFPEYLHIFFNIAQSGWVFQIVANAAKYCQTSSNIV